MKKPATFSLSSICASYHLNSFTGTFCPAPFVVHHKSKTVLTHSWDCWAHTHNKIANDLHWGWPWNLMTPLLFQDLHYTHSICTITYLMTYYTEVDPETKTVLTHSWDCWAHTHNKITNDLHWGWPWNLMTPLLFQDLHYTHSICTITYLMTYYTEVDPETKTVLAHSWDCWAHTHNKIANDLHWGWPWNLMTPLLFQDLHYTHSICTITYLMTYYTEVDPETKTVLAHSWDCWAHTHNKIANDLHWGWPWNLMTPLLFQDLHYTHSICTITYLMTYYTEVDPETKTVLAHSWDCWAHTHNKIVNDLHWGWPWNLMTPLLFQDLHYTHSICTITYLMTYYTEVDPETKTVLAHSWDCWAHTHNKIVNDLHWGWPWNLMTPLLFQDLHYTHSICTITYLMTYYTEVDPETKTVLAHSWDCWAHTHNKIVNDLHWGWPWNLMTPLLFQDLHYTHSICTIMYLANQWTRVGLS